MKPAELQIMACTDKAGERVWAVQSTTLTKRNGFPTFHLVTWNASTSAWECPCQSRKPCVHMRFASEASRIEQQRADAVFDALTGPYPDYDDSNPQREAVEATMRGYEPLTIRNTPPMSIYRGAVSPVLAERQREVM
jgi:hypothetical protein